MQTTPKTIHGSWNEAPDAVTLVDAHHHLWDLRMGRHPWLCGAEEKAFFMGDYGPLKKNYLPEDYRRDAAGHNVLTTVHCEAEWDREDQVGETRWITDIHSRYGFPGAIVAHAWFDTENAEEVIAAQAAFPLVRGIRSKPVTAPSPDRIEPGAPGTMQDERWLRGFALLGKYDLSWDLRVPFWHLDEAAAVARDFPNVRIILNHTGLPWDRSEDGLAAWRLAMETIAREPNVHVKISELGLKDRSWDYDENEQIVREAIGIFGVERCVFATNFPVAGLRIGYDELVRSVPRICGFPFPRDQERLFWRNAVSFYRLDSP